jgi:hypothetical protein
MNPSDIIRKECEKQNVDFNETIIKIFALLKKKLAVLLKQNDSLLLLIQLGDGDVELHLFTQDPPLTMFKSIQYFIDQVRKSDIRAVYAKAMNPSIIEVLKRLGVKIEESDRPEYNFKATV